MEAKIGDRISIDAKKVGQPRRMGVIRSLTTGLAGIRYQIRWEDGSETVMSPGAGTLTVEGKARPNSKRAKKSAPKRPTAKAKKTKKRKKR